MARMMILDGNSLINRAFYALPPLTSAEGLPTNAVHGFLTMLFRLQKEQRPDYWVVAFDKTKATVRIDQYAQYKAQRKETPETLRPQFAYLKEILEVLKVPILEIDGYEADDIIATVTSDAEKKDMEVSIFTGDRDALQLISPQTRIYLTKKGISEVECYDEEKLFEKYGLKPVQIVDLKALMGDSSDNIPGVPGVGEKTALKLLYEYETVDNILLNKENISAKRLRNLIIDYEEQALLSRKLARMINDVPISFSLNDLQYQEPPKKEALGILHHYSLHTVARLFEKSFNAPINSDNQLSFIDNDTDKKEKTSKTTSEAENKESTPKSMDHKIFSELTLDEQAWLKQMDSWSNDCATLAISYRYEGKNTHQGQWTEMGICDGKNLFLLVGNEQKPVVMDKWYTILANDKVQKIVADCKTLYSLLLNEDQDFRGLCLDLSLAAYLLNPSRTNYSAAELLRPYTEDLFGLPPTQEAGLLLNLSKEYVENLKDLGLESLLHDIEEPLSLVLARMEKKGIAVDKELLEVFRGELEEKIGLLEKNIHNIAELNFNINSPQQLGKVLFENLGLTPKKKTKTGYSTDAETLEELRSEHPLVEQILEYRQLVKLYSTYVKGLLNQLYQGRIQTTYQQTVTNTGRLSSTEPNLQNIPIRLEEGRKLRKVFKPTEEGWLLFSADYSQIELRILAHFSGDPILCESFTVGEDVHARTASEVFGVPLSDVTSDMRRKAKAVNFGLMYGLTDFGLARDLTISRKEAKYYITQYFERYIGVQRYMEEVVRIAKESGEVRTLLRRLRKIPELSHPNRMTRQFGERIAKNTPIQGTAADIMKIAMIKVADILKPYRADILLQVHDELVIQVVPEELDAIAVKVKETMEEAFPISVPLVVDCKVGENWFDMVKYGG
ncbi:MAG: DNA polymerase I [Gracilibacter sp. BRH_c7a]|nr:MAG: DNA polymerase I [Gracilibacter sp. BRH_c7a]